MRRSVCLMLALLLTTPALANLSDPLNWRFKVLLDDREIGFHEFVVSEEDGLQIVESEASFDVKVLFVNVFRYRHQNLERWAGNCLQSIDAATAANGDDFLVRGAVQAGSFKLESDAPDPTLPSCVMSFAYWDPDFLDETQLLNSQTGEYEAVTISRQGEENILVAGEAVPAIRYQVALDKGPITLWYAADDFRWLALESVARGGRLLRYEPEIIPEALPSSVLDRL